MSQGQPPLDLVVQGGRVADGTGRPLRQADVGVRDGRIAAIGDLRALGALRRIDARGRVVSPGFIDIHSHSDVTVLVDGRCQSTLRQGVTTLAAGNCGSSGAPATGLAAEEVARSLRRYGRELSWSTFGEYLDAVARSGTAVNFCSFVGHGRLRQAVMGGERRAATTNELVEMRRLLAECLEEGAIGMASGLIYPPSAYGTTAELSDLSEAVRERGGTYASHIRSEGRRLFQAVAEGIEIGRRSGVRVQLSHHKAAGQRNWGKVTRSLAMIDAARRDGVDVAADQYPYTASATGLGVVVPDWVHEGGTAKLVERLRDPEVRRRVADAETETERDWGRIVISRAPADAGLAGLTVAEIAARRGGEPLAAACDLLVENDGYVGIVIHSMREEDVREVMRAAFVCVGSDSSSIAPYGALGEGRPHPRTYGCFPRVLGRYVRELGVLTLEEAVRKMTGLTAARLGLRERGLVRVGWWADLVVFDPESVSDRATFDDPQQYPSGIETVIVNGHIQLADGEVAPALHGRVLRLGADAG